MHDSWELIELGNYSAAIVQSEYEFLTAPSGLSLTNAAIAHLLAGELDLARHVCERKVNFDDGESCHTFLLMGVIDWLSGSHPRAIDRWVRAESASYTDAAGGFGPLGFQMFAAVALGDERMKDLIFTKLRKLITNAKGSNGWPIPAAKLLIGDMTEAAVLEVVEHSAAHSILKDRWRCQAYFYFAVMAANEGKQNHAKECFNESVSQPSRAILLECEYYLAALWAGWNR